VDFSRLRQGEIVAGIAGAALIIFLFLPWYSLGINAPNIEIPDIPGLDEGPIEPQDVDVDDDASGWDSLTDIDGFLIAAAGLAGIALALLAAAGRSLNLGGLPRGYVTAGLGALATALIVWRIFAQPTPGADLKIGIFLGLLAALGVTVGAVMALRERGFEPFVSETSRPAPKKKAAAKKSAAKPASKNRT
jgi:hypothetical protein